MTTRKDRCRAELSSTILGLMAFGLFNVWMSMTGDDYFHISSVLCYKRGGFDALMTGAELKDGRGYKIREFASALKYRAEQAAAWLALA